MASIVGFRIPPEQQVYNIKTGKIGKNGKRKKNSNAGKVF
jgi:hypothetical protein